jgi:hypothetical protein
MRSCIKRHARATPRGRIVATLADYAAVFALVIDTLSEGVQATVAPALRETVVAVAALEQEIGGPVAVSKLAEKLGIDKSSASRRASGAARDGYLVNAEDKRGRPARLQVGEPLPAERPVLPTPADLGDLSGIPAIDIATMPGLAVEGAREVSELC